MRGGVWVDDEEEAQQEKERVLVVSPGRVWPNIAIFIGVLTAYCATRGPTPLHNEHAYQAATWLTGRTNVDPWAVRIWERVFYHGHFYILHPPLAAAVMVPFVWAGWGNQLFPLILIAAIGALLCYRLTESLWLTAFFAFGTDYWYGATSGDPWNFCLILSCIPTFLALLALRNDKPVQVGLWAGLAALARYDLVMVWPVYLWWQWRKGRYALAVLPGMLCALAFYLWYNQLRFGTWYDVTLFEWFRYDAPHLNLKISDGPFNLKYLPLGLYTALFLGPAFTMQFPWLKLQPIGQSLLTTSPAYLMALRPSLKTAEVRYLILCVGLSMGAALCVWSNGIGQFGARYWTQASPFLVALMARDKCDKLMKILIVASILMNAYGVWYIRAGYPF